MVEVFATEATGCTVLLFPLSLEKHHVSYGTSALVAMEELQLVFNFENSLQKSKC